MKWISCVGMCPGPASPLHWVKCALSVAPPVDLAGHWEHVPCFQRHTPSKPWDSQDLWSTGLSLKVENPLSLHPEMHHGDWQDHVSASRKILVRGADPAQKFPGHPRPSPSRPRIACLGWWEHGSSSSCLCSLAIKVIDIRYNKAPQFIATFYGTKAMKADVCFHPQRQGMSACFLVVQHRTQWGPHPFWGSEALLLQLRCNH